VKNQIVVIGAGPSIPGDPLFDFLKDKWTIGCNSIYKFLTPSALAFIDYNEFYRPNQLHIKNLPLVIGRKHEAIRPNHDLLLLPTSLTFDRSMKQGVYCPALCGVFALSLAVHFAQPEDEIYLLGFDFGAQGEHEGKPKTHFYQGQIRHAGVGKSRIYDSIYTPSLFDPYKTIDDLEICTVGHNSRLEQFKKIGYEEFYSRINSVYDQDDCRGYMRRKLNVGV
jgi:hypothetical protein